MRLFLSVLFRDIGLKDMKLRGLRLWCCRLHFSLPNMGWSSPSWNNSQSETSVVVTLWEPTEWGILGLTCFSTVPFTNCRGWGFFSGTCSFVSIEECSFERFVAFVFLDPKKWNYGALRLWCCEYHLVCRMWGSVALALHTLPLTIWEPTKWHMLVTMCIREVFVECSNTMGCVSLWVSKSILCGRIGLQMKFYVFVHGSWSCSPSSTSWAWGNVIKRAQGNGAVDCGIFVSKMWVSVSLAEAPCTDFPLLYDSQQNGLYLALYV